MKQYIMKGGNPLVGEVVIGGAKNAALGILAAAMDAPVAVMETAGEGGPWGMAILGAYMVHKSEGESLEDYLNNKVFAGAEGSVMNPDSEDVAGFEQYIQRFKACLAAEAIAVDKMEG